MSDTCFIESSHMFAVQSSCFWTAKRFCQTYGKLFWFVLSFSDMVQKWTLYALNLTKEEVLERDDEIEIMSVSRSPQLILFFHWLSLLSPLALQQELDSRPNFGLDKAGVISGNLGRAARDKTRSVSWGVPGEQGQNEASGWSRQVFHSLFSFPNLLRFLYEPRSNVLWCDVAKAGSTTYVRFPSFSLIRSLILWHA